jgi:DNA polymerase-1
LQNIPVRTDDGSRIRSAFVADKGSLIVSADYSQIELRLLAHCANIPSLIEAFKQQQDIHSLTASKIFGVPLEAVTPQMRREGKTVNFSIIYGISPYGLARRLEISHNQAKNYIDEYFKQYPEIKAYMQKTLDFTRAHGYIETIFGRKCIIEGINDRNFVKRSFAERSATNAPLQASAADIIKKAMSALPDDIRQYLILQIHDELLFEIPKNIVDICNDQIRLVMESAARISVPLIVDVTSGSRCFEAKNA